MIQGPVADPLDIDPSEKVERLSLDIRLADAELIGRYAAYKNMLAELTPDTRLKRQWSRKGMAESMLTSQVEVLKGQLKDLFEALGRFPPADDKDEMEKFVRRAIAWTQKTKK